MPDISCCRLCVRTTIPYILILVFALTFTLPMQAAAQNPEHLIICPAEYATIFQPLADHRSSNDVPSVVVTLESVLATAPAGRDDAETLRNYIVQQYSLGSLQYVLLGGDGEVMPVRVVQSDYYPVGMGSEFPTDLYFAGLDGDWDSDGDGIFAEPFVDEENPGDEADLDPEIAIGRAPVSTLAQAQRFVDGVLAYDGSTEAHFESGLFMAEVLFPSSWNGIDPITLDGASYTESLISILEDHPYPPLPTRMYENTVDYPTAIPLTRTNALTALSSGDHGLICNLGHGWTETFSAGDATIGNADIDALTNGPHYPFYYSMVGNGSDFTLDCLNRHLLNAPAGGAAGVLGFTDVTFPSTSRVYAEDFFTALAAETGVPFGSAWKEVMHKNLPGTDANSVARWTSQTMILLGDPAMPFRSEATPVPTFLSFFELEAGSNSVKARWEVYGDDGINFMLLGSNATARWEVPCSAILPGSYMAEDKSSHLESAGSVSYQLLMRAEGQDWELLAEDSVVMSAPAKSRLLTAYPNPFNPRTTLRFDCRTAGNVHLAVYDISGRRVALLMDEWMLPGQHEKVWDGTDDTGNVLAAGQYLIRFVSGDRVDTQKVVLAK